MRALSALLLLCVATFAFPQSDQTIPILTGCVTRVASSSDFDVNGIHILCGPDTRSELPSGDAYIAGCPQDLPSLGQQVNVYGHRKKSLNAIAADRLELKPLPHADISGYAVIDAVAETNTASGTVQFRADGYPILITAKTAFTFDPPLNSPADVMTNVWVEYDARPAANGVFVARTARFAQNFITDREDAMRAKTDYDPTAVPANAKQNPVALTVGIGPDPKKIPPWPDLEMQDRLNTIGHKLIPAYQLHLADSDPSKINFRFQLTDGKRWPAILTLPSGIILVPHEIVERMENDSQLAEILADAIACVLEKQTYRLRIASGVISAGSVASWAQFLSVVPVVGLAGTAAGIGSGTGQLVLLRKEEHQSGRVSLGLLHDAGYDVSQAPVAWWLLNSRKPHPVSSIAMPDRTAYLYRTLGEVWRNPPQATPPAAP
jgi:Domain of unknown function (DUF5666)